MMSKYFHASVVTSTRMYRSTLASDSPPNSTVAVGSVALTVR